MSRPQLRVPTEDGDGAAVSKADTVRAPNVASSSRERKGMDIPQNVGQGRFRLDRKVGEGSFGMVFIGFDSRAERQVAVKLEHKRSSGAGQLANESRLMDMLSRPSRPFGFAECLWFGKEGNFAIMAMDLLGLTLEDCVQACNGQVNPQSCAVVAEQSIVLLAYLHSKGLVHRDIKSENFMFGVGDKVHHLYIIDFGMTTRYYLKKHVTLQHGKQLTGTARYASVNAMRGSTQSRRDDLEALAHVVIYMLRGSLPWSGLDAPTYKDKLKRICEVKDTHPLDDLCAGFPDEFQNFLHYSRKMRFEAKPEYDNWVVAFRTLRLEKISPPTQAWNLQWLENKAIDPSSLVELIDEACAPQPEDTMMATSTTGTTGTPMATE